MHLLSRFLSAVPVFVLPLATGAGRTTISLDGAWEVADSVSADALPATFAHKAPVPGLANLATPPFPDVDAFDSQEVISNRVRRGVLPKSALVTTTGIPRQKRNYFWYSRIFKAVPKKEVAILKINKAQFGTAVWLNGKRVGEHLSCFTAGYFNVTEAMDWSGENRLVIRIGAHRAAMPESIPAGTDFEKNRWTPGIYDSVSLQLSDSPVIETLQVAPKVVGASEALVEVKLKNYSTTVRKYNLLHRVKEWKGGKPVTAGKPERGTLKPGEEKVIRQVIPMPGARLWSPEDPFLYVLETETGGDSAITRFGMREFRFDTPTRRAMLNGKVYFLRGSNITLHRFFEDPDCKGLPWDEAWVRKLLVEIPKKMHWNSFRFCIGPVPGKWLEIADEAGLLIQNEYFIWTGHPEWRSDYHRSWSPDVLINEYKAWMRDSWNHPSVAVWDANNESYDDVYAENVIPAVRGLDLSNRPWENSYNVPAGPDDPVEDHPYLFIRGWSGGKGFQMTELEGMWAPDNTSNTPSGHASVINEYGWLWLNRDGSPTELTAKVYKDLLGENSTAEQRFEMNAYLLGGLTEFWRAWRNHAGVLHFVYLTSSYPGAYTSDHFRDVTKLELDPRFADYVGEAFKPLGVYLHFWRPELAAGTERQFTVMMVNDDSEPAEGALTLTLETKDGREIARGETAFRVGALGQDTFEVDLRVPVATGDHILKAAAKARGGRHTSPTVSRRKVAIVTKPS
jgi:hypothetical protein